MACVENGLTVLFDRSPLFSLVVGHVGDGAHLSHTALCFSNPLLNSFRATRTPQQVSPHFRNTNPVPISAPVIQTLQSRARRCPRAPSLRSISHAKHRIRFAGDSGGGVPLCTHHAAFYHTLPTVNVLLHFAILNQLFVSLFCQDLKQTALRQLLFEGKNCR